MQLHTVLDEMILGGQVIETSSEEIIRSVEEIARFLLPRSFLPSPSHVPFLFFSAILTVLLATWHRLEKQSSTTSLIPKSISQRFSRWNFPVVFRIESVGPLPEEIRLVFEFLSPVACQFSEVLSICYSTWKLIGRHLPPKSCKL
jgi:hypothetical protein